MYGYGYGYYSMFDPTMILVLIGVFLSLGASAKVKSTYARLVAQMLFTADFPIDFTVTVPG